MCYCLRFSCSSEISIPIHCLGMFMKSPPQKKKKVKRLLDNTVLSCGMCGEGKGTESSCFCAVGVQLWQLPVSPSLSYNRFPDNHLMLLNVWMPPTGVGLESSSQLQSRRGACHSWAWHSLTASWAFVFGFRSPPLSTQTFHKKQQEQAKAFMKRTVASVEDFFFFSLQKRKPKKISPLPFGSGKFDHFGSIMKEQPFMQIVNRYQPPIWKTLGLGGNTSWLLHILDCTHWKHSAHSKTSSCFPSLRRRSQILQTHKKQVC